jgi:hypothetical protein
LQTGATFRPLHIILKKSLRAWEPRLGISQGWLCAMHWATPMHKSAISEYTCICESSLLQCFETQRQKSTLLRTFSHRNFSTMLTESVRPNFWIKASNATLVMFEPVHALAIGRTLGSDCSETTNVPCALHYFCYCTFIWNSGVCRRDGPVMQYYRLVCRQIEGPVCTIGLTGRKPHRTDGPIHCHDDGPARPDRRTSRLPTQTCGPVCPP